MSWEYLFIPYVNKIRNKQISLYMQATLVNSTPDTQYYHLSQSEIEVPIF